MDFVTPIITPIVESLMVPIKKHLGFFFCSTKHVTKMHDRLLVLNDTAHDMESKRELNEANNLVIPNHVSGWLAQVKTVNEKAGSIPTNGNGCFGIKLRYKNGKESVDILQKIYDLEDQESKIKWTNEQVPLGMVVSSTKLSTTEPLQDYDGIQNIFRSRQSIFKDVLKSLEPDSKIQKMAICGMGGMGKTTMMEEIKKVAEKNGMFNWVLRVVIGNISDPIAIQQAIAQYMGEALTETTRDARADRLRKRFEGMSGNGTTKILVILDDVWEEIDLKDIGLTNPLPNGFKLMLTSRHEKVCINMDIETSSIFRMVGLEESEANFLFWETVRLSGADNELRNIGEDILKMCGGLPMAIKTIALTLRGEKKDAWICALTRLQRHDLEDLYAIVDDILDITYTNLKKDDDKKIFILCGLFPDDFDIYLEELMRYAWGLGLFTRAYNLQEARQRTNASVSNLIRSNLLIESFSIGCVKMHDLARAFVLGNISKFKQASIVNHGDKLEWPTQDARESCERILLNCKGMLEFPEDFYYPNLSLLMLMHGNKLLKFPKDSHKRMEKLEVIAYYNMRCLLLPVSIQCSTSIRTLCLDLCKLIDNDISFLGDLINLEVLSVAYCGIKKLPSSIGKLKKLKLLDLTGCVDLHIDDGVFQNLDKLEELYIRTCNRKAIRLTNANCEELEMLSRLYALEVELYDNIIKPKNLFIKKLQRFRISIGCLLSQNTNYTNNEDPFRNTLKLVANCSELLQCQISELFSQTEELHLSVKDMCYVEDISMHPSQHSTFCNLKILHVFNCADLRHLFTVPMANGLKKLERLTISSCHVLESLVSLSENVKVIELPQLMELNLYDLPNFTSIFPEGDISGTKAFLNNEVVIPKLSKLIVGNMKNLKQIWPCHIASGEDDNISMLRVIDVLRCDSLINLFPSNPMRLLTHLEELKVQCCCSIEVLFNIDLGKVGKLGSSTVSKLRSIEAWDLKELREVWRIKNKNNSGILIRDFQAVKTIKILRCMNFRNLFTPTTVNFDMRAVTKILIQDSGRDDVKLINISQKQGIGGGSKLERLKAVEKMSIVAFPPNQLTHTFHQLRDIRFDFFKGVDVVFDMESAGGNNEESITTQEQPLPLLPYIEELSIRGIYNLIHVWKCGNWNKFFILHKHQPQSSFQNLTTIYLNQCHRVKYLFSPMMSQLLCSLKTIGIDYCEGIEEVVSHRDDEEDEVLTTSTRTLFPHLDCLDLRSLYRLKHIGGGVATETTNAIHDQLKLPKVGPVSWSLCQYPRKINIEHCTALSTLIPSYVVGQMQKLQVLRIKHCTEMMEVFETKDIKGSNTNNSSCSSSNFDQRSDVTIQIPRPKIITMHELPNLKKLKISYCSRLEYVLPFSALKNLKTLEKLRVHKCEAMKVIVKEETRDTSSKVVIVFPRLKSIELEELPNLAGFFLGTNIDFQLPSLDYVMIADCPQMTVLTSGESKTPKLKYIHTWLGKYNLECGLDFHQIPPPSSDSSSLCPAIAEGTPWSLHNLIEIDLENIYELKKIVSSSELLLLKNLEKIHVSMCHEVVEVFEVASKVIYNKSQTVVKFPKLREMELEILDSLRYIWKSNQWKMFEFPSLTKLSIHRCDSLEYVFTASMVGALTQLQDVRIRDCGHMEVIIKKEEEYDDKVSEITFPHLKSLKLDQLPCFKGFCLEKMDFLLPSLSTLVIEDCPEIALFTEGRSIAPELKVVKTSIGLYHVGEDINSFIMTKKQEGTYFGVKDHYSSSEDE